MIKTTRTTLVNEGIERHDFGVTDFKGRAIGCTVAFQVVELAPSVEGQKALAFYQGEPGTYFAWVGNATRAGEGFGAMQTWRLCKSEKERFAQVAAYLKGAQARAEKTARKV